MNYPRLFTNTILPLTIPSMAAYPQYETPQITIYSQAAPTELDLVQKLKQDPLSYSYDDILNLLDQIESGELEKSCNEEDLERINQFLAHLAAEGMISGDPNEEFLLAYDIHNLLQDASSTEYAYSYGDHVFSIIPCKSWIHKRWDVTKKFVKKHKKAIIIGAITVVVVTVVILTAGLGAAAAPAAAGAAGAAKADQLDQTDTDSNEEEPPSAPSTTTPTAHSGIGAAQDSSALRSTLETQISSLKCHVAEEQNFLQPNTSPLDFSLKENGRILGSVYAHRQVEEQAKLNPENLGNQGLTNSTDAAHRIIDERFSTYFTNDYLSASQIGSKTDFSTNLYQLRGQSALDLSNYDQAISDLDKTLELTPNNPDAYLGRAKAYLGKGDYEKSLADYQEYTAKKPTPAAYIVDFSIGFAKGLAKGAYDSAEQLAFFVYTAAAHPIDTGGEIYEAFCLMSKLVAAQEWATIGKALSPEVHKLITEWETLPPMEKGEGAAHALGKHGTDIFLPCATAKAVSKCAVGTQEILTASRIIKGAEQTLVLETIAYSGTSAEEIAQALAKLGKRERAAVGSGGLTTINGVERIVAREIDHLGQVNQRVFEGWVLPKDGGGALINGRWYTEHALERMAPNTPEVMAILENRALERAKALGLEPTTQEFGKWMQRNGPNPRGIPPSIVEAEIAQPGSTKLQVILNEKGDVVTVMSGGQ